MGTYIYIYNDNYNSVRIRCMFSDYINKRVEKAWFSFVTIIWWTDKDI